MKSPKEQKTVNLGRLLLFFILQILQTSNPIVQSGNEGNSHDQMCSGNLIAHCSYLFVVDMKGHFSLIQEMFEVSSGTRTWPVFFLMSVGDFFPRLLDAK